MWKNKEKDQNRRCKQLDEWMAVGYMTGWS